MAGPWDKYSSQTQTQAAPGEAEKLQPRPAGAPSKAYTGTILPFSIDEHGRGRFDTNAGIGGLKRQITTTGDVLSGELDLSTEEGFARALELSTLAAPVPPGIRAGRLGSVAPKVSAPTSEALRAAADEGFKAVRDMGVDYTTPSVTKMIGRVRGALEQKGLFAEAAPITRGILQKFDYPPEGSFVGIAALEAAKKAARRAAKGSANEQLAASRLMEEIDQYIMAADLQGVLRGPAARAGKELSKARGNSAAHERSNAITGVKDRPDLRSAADTSGPGLDTVNRKRILDVLRDPKRGKQFTPDEIALLEQFVLGRGLRNGLRSAQAARW